MWYSPKECNAALLNIFKMNVMQVPCITFSFALSHVCNACIKLHTPNEMIKVDWIIAFWQKVSIFIFIFGILYKLDAINDTIKTTLMCGVFDKWIWMLPYPPVAVWPLTAYTVVGEIVRFTTAWYANVVPAFMSMWRHWYVSFNDYHSWDQNAVKSLKLDFECDDEV